MKIQTTFRFLRHALAGSLVLAVLSGSVGCATFWEAWRRDPITQTQTILSTVSTIVSVARVAFGSVLARLPEADRGPAQERFDRALLTIASAEAAVRAALDVAAETRNEHPDLKVAFGRLLDAAVALQEVVGVVRGGFGAGMTATVPRGYDQLEFEIQALRTRVGVAVQ